MAGTERRLFGTDGIRGVANISPMTAELGLKVGQAVAAYFARNPRQGWNEQPARPRIVIGKDTRRSNYMMELAISSGVCSMGVDALLLGPLPTPGISFCVTSMRADAGIVISASHNSFEYSGIKIFGRNGDKLPDDVERELEKLILGERPLPEFPTGAAMGRAQRLDDVMGRYIVHTKAAFSSSLALDGMRIVLDCAHGAAYKVAPTIFHELGAEVIATGVEPNGLNINDQVGALYPQRISDLVKKYRADIGVSLDGDGDRVILSDERGEIVDGDGILAICALAMKKSGTLNHNKVVGTIMCNWGLRVALENEGISFCEVPVGDRYILEELRRSGASLGGEPSGHIIFTDHASTGDGILAALKILEVMSRADQSLSELTRILQPYPQVLECVPIKKKVPISDLPDVQKRIDQIHAKLSGKGRIVVRYSGTEPVVRVMVEGENATEIQNYATEVAQMFSKV